MGDEILIVVESDGTRPRFRLTVDGRPARVGSVALVDGQSEQPLWWLVPASFTAVLPFTVEEVREEEADSLADEAPIDPIEDLPPTDPRHRAAIAARDSLNQQAFPELESLTYGAVPPGLRQASPEGGAVPLAPGRTYHLTAIGPAGHGSVEFRVV